MNQDTLVTIAIWAGLAMVGWVVAVVVWDLTYGRWMHKHPSSRWGCCGCGSRHGDVAILDGDIPIESYCWKCYDRPERDPEVEKTFKAYPIRVFEGCER